MRRHPALLCYGRQALLLEVVAGRRKHMEGDSGVGHNAMRRPPALMLLVPQKVEGENMELHENQGHHLIGSQAYFSAS